MCIRDRIKRKDYDEGLRWFRELCQRLFALDVDGNEDETHAICKKAIPGGIVLRDRARNVEEEFELCGNLSFMYRELEMFKDAEKNARRAIELERSSFGASLRLYLALALSGKTKVALDEIWRYTRYDDFVKYKDTIEELIADLRTGYLLEYRLTITALAEKAGLRVD